MKKDLKDIEEVELSNNEFKRIMIRMIDEVKEDMRKHLMNSQDTNKQLNEFKDNSN
jgi:hypothetical protein